jgi:hypothetical protein
VKVREFILSARIRRGLKHVTRLCILAITW